MDPGGYYPDFGGSYGGTRGGKDTCSKRICRRSLGKLQSNDHEVLGSQNRCAFRVRDDSVKEFERGKAVFVVELSSVCFGYHGRIRRLLGVSVRQLA